MKLLIISDNPSFRGGLSQGLNSLVPRPALNAVSLNNGRQQLLSDKPDAALLDIDSEFCPDPAAYIMNLAPRYYVPLIVITTGTKDMTAIIRAGAVDIITRKANEAKYDRLISRIETTLANIKKAAGTKSARLIAANDDKLIAIGGSTGSTNALPVVLKGIKADCPPIVCVLHMPEGYTKLYADQLNSSMPLEVVEAQNGMYLKRGQAVIAQGRKQLRVFHDDKGYFIKSEAGPKVNGHCPSVSVLFESVAYAARSNAIGVMLTGMGSDGADGMATMRRMGAYNIAESESTAVVYGMPKAAVEAMAVNVSKPLGDIAATINNRI